jgi:GNAT superfamily N-acetyltransferase
VNDTPQAAAGLEVRVATSDDVAALAELHAHAAASLTDRYGKGPWSNASKDAAVRRALVESHVVVGELAGAVVGTFSLQRRKPWAIDLAYFTEVVRPVYLKEMAVEPEWQRRGVGRALLARADRFARELRAGAIRLDAWDAPAGAGGFYARCGYAARGGKVYRGNPLLYFERLLDVAPATGAGGRS